jgi:hypothetical protein
MATDPNSILAITQPRLEIKTISHTDIDNLNAGMNPNRPNNAGLATTLGYIAPYIEIDNYIIQQANIHSISIHQNGFLPEITVNFLDSTGAFSGRYFPKTNPIMKVYIKSLSPTVKPVRSDYLITNISSSEIGNSHTSEEYTQTMYTVSGTLYIPGIYGNNIQSIPNKKSWEALKYIADSLKLGFATNETATDDLMTWINPNDSVEQFIKNICSRAYKNDKSFFDCFIDINYILNFVNYEKSLSKETKNMEAPTDSNVYQLSDIGSTDPLVTKDNAPNSYAMQPVILKSSMQNSGTGFNIVYYSMHSEHGEILANQLFRKSIIWHDRKYYLENKKELEFYLEPLSEKTIDSKDTVYQKPKPTNFELEKSSRWVGIDYNNGHTNYKFSRLLNYHNLTELSKNYLTVKLPGVVQSIYRGGKLTVIISRLADANITGITADSKFGTNSSNLTDNQEEIDLYASGPYVVKDIMYGFDSSPIVSELRYYTELVLVRREWVELGDGNKLQSEITK